MTRFQLKRVAMLPTNTFGVLLDNGVPFAVTLERPWLNNERGKSCIPAGTYACKRVDSPKFGNTFEVTGVTGRSAILFHKGNLSNDTHGCILVGEQFEPLNGENAIIASKHGFDEFLRRTEGLAEFTLDVLEWPTSSTPAWLEPDLTV